MNKLVFLCVFLPHFCFSQTIGLVIGTEDQSWDYTFWDIHSGGHLGIDFRVGVNYDALIFKYRFHTYDLAYNRPDLGDLGVAYRLENLQLVFRKHIVAEIVDFGLHFDWLLWEYQDFEFKYHGVLLHFTFGYGFLTRNKSLGLQYVVNLYAPRRYTQHFWGGFYYNGHTKPFTHGITLLYYPVFRFKKEAKPMEIRRRNR